MVNPNQLSRIKRNRRLYRGRKKRSVCANCEKPLDNVNLSYCYECRKKELKRRKRMTGDIVCPICKDKRGFANNKSLSNHLRFHKNEKVS